jgi:DNA helicase II / ATP-dependent DNA helicase PcrA
MSESRQPEPLNSEQRRAVEHGICSGDARIGSPLLIVAGAGCGKTKTLAHRVAHLMVGGANPGRILLLTFSRRAATEMERRVQRIVGSELGEASARRCRMIWSGTFHAVGARLLRLYAGSVGLDPTFTIHDREDSADLINLVRHELGLSDKAKRFPLKATCLAIYSRAVNSSEALDLVLAGQFPWCSQWERELRQLFDSYVEAKQKQHVLDYDDLLLYWAELMKVPALASDIGSLFDHVLVDEYQDTNAIQAAILRAIKPDGVGLTVVGDDAQSIYRFRAASVRNILDFPQQFSNPATVVILEQNYRSTQAILTAANAVIGLAPERFTKNLRSQRCLGEKPGLVTVLDDVGQVNFVVENVLKNRESGVALKQQAVLFRTAHHSALLEIELTRRSIPFVKFGGLRFIEAAHVKDMLAILRWAENPADRVTGFRVIQLLSGIGPATAGKILNRMSTNSPIDALAAFPPPAKAADLWPGLVTLMVRLHGQNAGWPSEFELARQWYQPRLEERYPDASTRLADLDRLAQIAHGYTSRGRFLTDLTLDPPSATSDESKAPLLDEDYLILSTIHSAKGQEWKTVYVLNVVDGCIPSDMATSSPEDIEEERRLLYVAMTRAKDQLFLTLPHRFYTHQQAKLGDRHVYAARTRFIPASIVDHFECSTWPAASNGRDAEARPIMNTIDVGARIRGMWREAGT